MLGGGLNLAASGLLGAEPERHRFEVCAFTKPFRKIAFDQLADTIADIGFDGIEAPVRPGGHIEPEETEDKFPQLVEVLKERGLKISILTTAINSLDQPHAKRVLQTAATLGIKTFRMAYYRYDLKQPILQQLDSLRPKIKDLVAFCRDEGITPLYQNHSGATRVGAPLWDIHRLMSSCSSEDVGLAFDLGHATIEGGQSWPIQFNLVRPLVRALYVKDFRWSGARARWVPLGEGVTDQDFYRRLRSWKFRGPLSLHVEYVKENSIHPKSKLVSAFRSDLRQLRTWLSS